MTLATAVFAVGALGAESASAGTVVEMPKLAAEMGVSGAEHLFLKFGSHAFSADRSTVNTFGPRGLSGGALLDLGDFTGPAVYVQDKRYAVPD